MPSDDSPLLFRHSSRRLPRAELTEFLGDLSRRILRRKCVTCLITDDREMRRLNRTFRNQNHATDVLSFPSENGGELAISLDRAVAQAAGYGHSVADEIRILMLHGVLHLAGMDHERDSGQMEKAEAAWRKRLGLPSSLIERALA
jgi:probable rRNA maturation factor